MVENKKYQFQQLQHKPFYITTPIYYVNDTPHIGHTYTTLIADILSRWYRMNGNEVFFLTGTDEHGLKVLEAAKSHNKQPKEYCDIISEEFKSTWKLLNIKYDCFIRTTDETHISIVHDVFNKLYNEKKIYKKKYSGLYCIECETYISESDLVDSKCPTHKTKPIFQEEENYFLKLIEIKDELIKMIKDKSHPQHFSIIPEERKNEILGKLNLEMQDISISREKLKWGIPLPFDKTQTAYVWIDALVNYISGIKLAGKEIDEIWPADIHLIGKDILWFHTVIWPVILYDIGLPSPKKIYAHGFFTVNGQKMSKTLGNVIRPKELIDIFGVDATRFLIVSSFPSEQDGDISIEDMKKRYVSNLMNNLGNFITRVTAMIKNSLNNKIPHRNIITEIERTVKNTISEFSKSMENLQIYDAANNILQLSNFGNRYFDSQTPWIYVKTNIRKFEEIIYNSLFIIKNALLLAYPFMPNTSARALNMIDEPIPIFSQEPSPVTGSFLKRYEIPFPKLQD